MSKTKVYIVDITGKMPVVKIQLSSTYDGMEDALASAFRMLKGLTEDVIEDPYYFMQNYEVEYSSGVTLQGILFWCGDFPLASFAEGLELESNDQVGPLGKKGKILSRIVPPEA